MKKQWIVLDYSPEQYCNLKIDVIGYDKSKRELRRLAFVFKKHSKKKFKGSHYGNHRRCTWFDKSSGSSFSKEFKDKVLVSSMQNFSSKVPEEI